MSGPLTEQDAAVAGPAAVAVEARVLERLPSRAAEVSGLQVRRALPRRGRRTVGAWCFADHFGPVGPEAAGVRVGPHPHIGLQTVTWLLQGEVLHTDSLGSEQLIRPGELNLMTAGGGVVHAEESRGTGGQHGLQLWVALPDATRHGPAAFEHHAELPTMPIGPVLATVVLGTLGGVISPAHTDTPLVGADLGVSPGTAVVPLETSWEHALVVLAGSIAVDEDILGSDVLLYLGTGRDELQLRATEPARAFLIGGRPFGEDVLMWWNFVARTRDEIDAAYSDWEGGSSRFGSVRSSLPRIPAPRPIWSGGGR